MSEYTRLAFLPMTMILVSLACTGSDQAEVPTQTLEELQTIVAATMAADSGESEATPVPAETEPPPATEPPPSATPIPASPTPIVGLVGVGTHVVGEDLEAGIYMGMAGDDLFGSCYWERLSGLSGEFDDVIANDNAVGLFYIEVKATDVALSTDCPLISLEQGPIPEESNPLIVGPGTYLVGRDIQSGRYRGQAGADILDSCYWERLSDVSGELDGIITNENATGQFFVQVAGTDFALTTDCELEFVQP